MWSKSRCYQEKPYVLVSISSVPNVSTKTYRNGMKQKKKKKKTYRRYITLTFCMLACCTQSFVSFYIAKGGGWGWMGGRGGGREKFGAKTTPPLFRLFSFHPARARLRLAMCVIHPRWKWKSSKIAKWNKSRERGGFSTRGTSVLPLPIMTAL